MHAYGSLSFQSPPSWRDHHVLLFSPIVRRPGAPNIIMTRAGRGATNLASYAWAELVDLAKSLPAFSLIGTEEIEVGGRKAIRARFTSGRGEARATLEEVIAYIDTPEGDVITLGCSWIASEPSDARDVFDPILATARFDGPGDDAEPPSSTLPGNRMVGFVTMSGDRARS